MLKKHTAIFAFTCLLCNAAVADQSFSAKSGSINVDCDQWGSATATFTLPESANITSYSGRWVDLSNIKESRSDAVIDGRKVIASGAIRGFDANWVFGVRTCPGGGHGTLEVFGTYK